MRTFIAVDPIAAARFVVPTSPLAQEVLPYFTPLAVWFEVPRRKDRWARDLSPRLREHVLGQLS